MEIVKGQSLLVIGHSGCGKSSLLRAIAGELDHPNAALTFLLLQSSAHAYTDISFQSCSQDILKGSLPPVPEHGVADVLPVVLGCEIFDV